MNRLDARHEPAPVEDGPPADRRRGHTWTRHLSVTNISVIYALAVLIVVFSVWAPETFPTWTTARSILNGSAVPGLIALVLVIPLSARLFDLSIGNALGLANMLAAWLLVQQGFGIAATVALTLLVGLAMGVFNGLVVVGARIDSFVGTLATGALFATAGSILSDRTITGPQLSGSFSRIATSGWFGLTLPFFLTVAVVVLLWFFQKHTPTGRRIYALGFNERGAELVGIRTRRLRFAGLVLCGFVAGAAGILLASSVTSGTPNIGPPYLLDAYAAAFLGATQFGGRFNAWGTLLAVVLINTGTNGIFLVGGPPWAQSMFSGVVLLLALGASNLEQAIRARSWIRSKARQDRDGAAPRAPHLPANGPAGE